MSELLRQIKNSKKADLIVLQISCYSSSCESEVSCDEIPVVR